MFPRKIISFIFIVIVPLVIWSCGSSAEYTSAKMAIEKSKWAEAEEYLFKALEVEPANAEVMVQIGYHVHARKEQWDEMNKIFEQALKLNPTLKVNVANIPSTTVSNAIEQIRNRKWLEYYQLGFKKYKESRNTEDKSVLLQAAVNLFNDAATIEPNEAQTYSVLANCYFELGDTKGAVNNAKMAHELIPNDWRANYNLGQMLAISGEKENAITYFKKAVEIAPTEVGAIKYLAELYYQTGLIEKSIETFEIAIKQESEKKGKANLYYNLGVLHYQLDNFEEADIAFEEAYYYNDEDFEALVGMATIYESQADKYFNGEGENFPKDYYKAEKLYKKAKSKYRDLSNKDPDNEEKYKKQLNLIDYKLNIAKQNQN